MQTSTWSGNMCVQWVITHMWTSAWIGNNLNKSKFCSGRN